MDKLVREAQEFAGGVQLETSNVNLLLFAGNVMFLAKKCKNLKRNLNEPKKKMGKWEMKIHWGM